MAITASNNLRKGSKGDDVRALQTALNNYGYGLDVDGSFGSKTQAAVRDYQSKNGLTVDGVVGTNTWGRLSGGSQAASDASSAAAGASSGSSSQSSSTATLTALQQVQANRPAFNWNQPAPTYQPTYQEQIAELTNKVMNRGPFRYDLQGDMLYQQYKDQYTRLGQRASADAQAQAAALSGGYGNSYGATAGNQAYQNYLNALNDRVPELEQRAYERWLNEGQQAENRLQLYRDMENQDYGRYRDTYGDYLNDRNFAYNQYADALSQYNADRAFEYQAEQDAYDRALQEAALAAKASGGSSSGGGSGRGRSGSSKSSSSGTTVSGTSQANAALNDLGNEFQSFASANDPKGMQTYLQKLVKAGYLTSQNATMIYNRYFPTTKSSSGSGGGSTKAARNTLRTSRVN